MKFLVYCIFRGESLDGVFPHRQVARRRHIKACRLCRPMGKNIGGNLPPGVEGGKVQLFLAEGLGAVVSALDEACTTPNVARAVAYGRVIEASHKVCTVLPMRYGCLLDSEGEIKEFLIRHRTEFLAALAEVDGCVEMGLRVLLCGAEAPCREQISRVFLPHRPASRAGLRPAVRPADAAKTLGAALPPSTQIGRRAASSFGGSPGAAYLADRRGHYREKDGEVGEAEAVIERIRQAFEGLYTHCKAERRSTGDRTMASLYFLVRRERLQAFLSAFARLREETTDKILLTGPWPAYNFVHPALGGGH